MAQPLLHEGEYVEDGEHVTDNFVADKLRTENRELRNEVARLKSELHSATVQNSRAVSRLRTLLSPLFRGLQDVFGEMDVIGDTGAVQPIANNPKWEFWKKRYPGRIADTIDLLLVQGEMNAKQLCSALKCDPRTLAKSVIYQLNSAGLINKNGGKFSLKEL
jgi:hypothetical protein